MKARVLYVFLIALLALSGCSKESISIKRQKLETGDIKDISIVIKVGDTDVKYSEVRNYCYLLKCQYEDNFGKELWQYKLDSDSTIGDEARQEVASLITQLKIIKKTAENMKVALTSDEKNEAVRNAEEIVNNASAEDKKAYCLNVQNMTELYSDNILAEKMFYIATDDADTVVTDDEARQIDIQYIEVITKGTDRNGNYISMNAKDKKEAKKRALRLLNEAKKSKNFLEFAEENTDAENVSATIGKNNDLLGRLATDEALKLKKGKISNVISSKVSDGTEGYVIIYCINNNNEDATYDCKESIIEERQTNMFKDKYAEWLKGCDVKISQSFWEEFEI